MTKLKSGMIGLTICSSFLISGCTGPLITVQVESPKQPMQSTSENQPSMCIASVNADSSEATTSSIPESGDTVDELSGEMPPLSPIAEEHAHDYEYIINRLLDYIDELQVYILDNS